MKKIFAVILAAALCLSLAACGKENAPKEGEIQNPAAVLEPEVEIKGDKVVSSSEDGLGTKTISEYVFKDGELAKIKITFDCGGKTAAEKLYESMTSGELMETASQSYEDIKLEGEKVVCKMTESYVLAFEGFGMEELAAVLSGEISGSAAEGETSFEEPSEIDETVYNIKWSDLNLPEGFPELDSGVTGYTEFQGGAMLSWNAMSMEKLEKMIAKLEDWAGVPVETVLELSDSKTWSAENEKMSLSVNYFADTLDSQVMITVQTF